MRSGWKSLLMIGISVALMSGSSFAASTFSKRLYCQVQGSSVRVYLASQANVYRCESYLGLLKADLQKEYQQVGQALYNLNRGDDKDYWQALYEEKKESFLKLFAQMRSIEEAISEFEEAFLIRSQLFIADSLEKKAETVKAKLEDFSAQLALAPNPHLTQRIKKFEELSEVIKKMQETKDIDVFLQGLNQYLVLVSSDLIAWK